jgi:DtxR family transcriptional regulator, Mn-dependent transcriptional regulator
MSSLRSNGAPSVSVGDYVKAVWEVADREAASTKAVAARLSVSPASVSGMFARLQEMGLVEYERYRGAALTQRGYAEALRLVRRHRLIETFLVERLGYSWQDVHDEAEKLEHAVSDTFTERLSEFLGHPEQDPHGDPIPGADGAVVLDEGVPLDEVEAGGSFRITRVGHRDPEVLSYLGERGLVPGRALSVREVRRLDGVVMLEDEGGEVHALGGILARGIFVRSV